MSDMDIEDDEARGALTSWAVLALAAAFALVLGSSLIDLQRANTSLTNLDAAQVAAVSGSHRSEDQLNALARGLQSLADQGDANAAGIVATLQRNGVHINANTAVGAAAPTR